MSRSPVEFALISSQTVVLVNSRGGYIAHPQDWESETQEVAISKHIKSIDAAHPGKDYLRVTLDDFQVNVSHGFHQCLAFPALGRSVGRLRDLFDDRALDKTLLQRFLIVIVTALNFMHQAGIVHTGSLMRVSDFEHAD